MSGVTPPAVLEIDLDAIAENWRRLDASHPRATAAVLKADAYGLGAKYVAPKLVAAGCRHFFTAHLAEALEIRDLIFNPASATPHSSLRAPFSSSLRAKRSNPDSDPPPPPTTPPLLAVLHGILPGEERTFFDQHITPVLCSLSDIALWRAEASRREQTVNALLHIDTGMSRTGVSPSELQTLRDDATLLAGINIHYLMTHLVSAELPSDPINQTQLARFQAAKTVFPAAGASLANSSGSFLGEDFTADLTRPGAALYGVNPTPGDKNPMRFVVTVHARVLQIREIQAGETVGYNGIWTARRPTRIATIAAGYADGYHRSLSNAGKAFWNGDEIPLVGRVSMDLTTFDVTEWPEIFEGSNLQLIGEDHPVDALAIEAGTNGYEILTSLGRRYHRRYTGSP